MATYYVATTGNDTTGNGSSGNPWLTLSKAVTSSSGGDTIQFASGTYTWGNQSISNRTLIAASYGDVIFDAGATYAKWEFGSGAVNIYGIVFTNNVASVANAYKPIFSVQNTSSQEANFYSCIFYNIYVTGKTGWGHLFANNAENAIGSSAMIYTLTSCLLYQIYKNTSSDGGAVFGCETNAFSVTITACSFYHDGTGSNALTSVFSDNAIITGSIVNSVFDSTASLTFGTSDTGLTNNVSYCCGHNITSFPSGTGNISSDPLYIDPANGNMELRPSSPCLDTGVIV